MPSKEVVTFWLDMGAPISLLPRSSCDSPEDYPDRDCAADNARTRANPAAVG